MGPGCSGHWTVLAEREPSAAACLNETAFNPAVAGERQVMQSVTELVMHDFGIAHSTIQVEIAGDNVACHT
jgi:hypothetical protein